MLTTDQLANLDATIRVLKAQNRILNGGAAKIIQEQQEALDAANANIQEALNNGNYDLVASYTASAKIARQKMATAQKRLDAATSIMDEKRLELVNEDWLTVDVVDDEPTGDNDDDDNDDDNDADA